MQFSLQKFKLISLLHERMGRVYLIGWSLGEWKRQIKKIWNNDFSLLFVWLNFLVKLELIFFFKTFHSID